MPATLSFARKEKAKTAIAIIFASQDKKLSGAGAALDQKAGGLITAAIGAREGFKGKAGDVLAVFLPKASGYGQALVVGLGAEDKLSALAFENMGGKAFAALKIMGSGQVNVLMDAPSGPVKPGDAAAAFAVGMKLRDYHFGKYNTGDKEAGAKKPASKTGVGAKGKSYDITVVTEEANAAKKAYDRMDAVAAGVYLARDLVNEPANMLYPESYAAIIARELKPLGVEIEIFDEKKMQKLGFGAHLAVGMGSARPPRVVIMRWNGKSGGAKGKKPSAKSAPLALVGKGVTFDTGGISIKPAAGMEEMKMDMGGSAAVVGTIRALAARKAKVEVIGIVGLAENMPSDRAYRPGDIVTSLSGKTIEILNTDAEGRLVLADALTYIQNTYKPAAIIDLATLTGAIMVALGYEYAGVFANDDALWANIDSAAKATGEKVWRMPLDEAYREEMRSTIADLKNLGNQGRYGGACSAAGFLEHFVNDGTVWAHIDIAGTAWGKSDKATVPRGGTGYGVRLLEDMIARHYEG